jgi:hypothetical protein
MAAYIRDAEDVTATNGTVWISADETATIDATSTATAVAVAASLKGSLAASGGGAIAVNLILGEANAFIEDSSITATGSGVDQGEVNLEADHESEITALVKATAASVAVSGGTTPAVAIGFSLARNLIGWTEYGGSDPIEVQAYATDTQITAAKGITVSADSTAVIDATVSATSVAIALSAGSGGGLSAAGLWTDNKIAADIQAYLDGSTGIVAGGDLRVTADDNSTITADAQAASVAASLTGGNGGALSIGLSLAHNTIDNDIAAVLKNAGSVTTGGSDVIVAAHNSAAITAESVAVAVSLGISGGSVGFAISGGGSESTNVILTKTNASIENSQLGTSGNKVGSVDLDASSDGAVDAVVGAVAASVSFGSTTGVGVSLGVAVARNFIGWDPSGANSLSTTYTTDQDATTLVPGETVRIASGARRATSTSTWARRSPTATPTWTVGRRSIWRRKVTTTRGCGSGSD